MFVKNKKVIKRVDIYIEISIYKKVMKKGWQIKKFVISKENVIDILYKLIYNVIVGKI